MIKNFLHKGLETFFRTGSKAGIQPHHAEKLIVMLTMLDNAKRPEDMNAQGWKLHSLTGKLAGHYSVTVNGNWRMTFVIEDENAELVDYQDYHQEKMKMSRMHNPAHPGEVLREWMPEGMTVTAAAKELQVSRVTLSKILNGQAGVTAGMALRLSIWLGTSPDVWLGMQTQWELWQAEKLPKPKIKPLERLAA